MITSLRIMLRRWRGRWLLAWLNFFKAVIQRFFADGCMYQASALTFASLLAVVPLMLVGVSVLAAFPVFDHVGISIQDFIFSNFVPASGQVIQQYLLSFVRKSGQLSVMGIASLLVTAVLMMFTMEQAFNSIWRVTQRRRGIYAFLIYWAILTLSPLFLGLSFATSAYLLSLPTIADVATMLGLTHLLVLLPLVMAMIVFTILYVAVPNCRVPYRVGLVVGAITAVAFELAKWGLTVYVSSFSNYQLLYGALSAIPAFLIWVYLSWVIILLGAEFCHGLTYRHRFHADRKLDGFTHAWYWLGYLYQAQLKSQGLTLVELVRKDRCGYAIEPERQMQRLQDAQLVQRGEGEQYFLAMDLHNLTLAKLLAVLPWKLPEADHLIIINRNGERLQKLIREIQAADETITQKPVLSWLDVVS